MSDDFLTKTEFFQYMGKFETNLENRLTKLESKIVNGQGNSKNNHVLADLLKMAIGAILLLGGVAGGKYFF